MKHILVDIAATGHDIRKISPVKGAAITDNDIAGVAGTVQELVQATFCSSRAAGFRCWDRIETRHWHWTHGRNTDPATFIAMVRTFPTGMACHDDYLVLDRCKEDDDPGCGSNDLNIYLRCTVTDGIFEAVTTDPDNFSVLEID